MALFLNISIIKIQKYNNNKILTVLSLKNGKAILILKTIPGHNLYMF